MSWRLVLISTLGGVFVVLLVVAVLVFFRDRQAGNSAAAVQGGGGQQASITSVQVVGGAASGGGAANSAGVMTGDGRPLTGLDADANPATLGGAPGGGAATPLGSPAPSGSTPVAGASGSPGRGADLVGSAPTGPPAARPPPEGGWQDTDPSNSRVRGPGPVEPEADIAPRPAGRPSFSCRQARTWSERAICSNRVLSQADLLISQAYYRLQGEVEDPEPLQTSQRAFLRERDSCQTMPDPTACLAQVHARRLMELGQWRY